MTYRPTEEWELDFGPEFQVNTCDHCKAKHIAQASVEVKKWVGDGEITLRFCSQKCSQDFYIARLREGGM